MASNKIEGDKANGLTSPPNEAIIISNHSKHDLTGF